MKEALFKKIPWMKITAPMIPLILVNYFFGKFLVNLHSLNLQHGVADRFPSDRAFYIFLVGNLLIIFAYLIISVHGQISQTKIDKIRANSELNTVKEA